MAAKLDGDRNVAVGLLTASDLTRLSDRFDRIYPIETEDDGFADLLKAIDEAERRLSK